MDQRFRDAVHAFEDAHRSDPRRITVEEKEVPYSLHYHRRLHYWVKRLAPDADEPLKLAANCQHIRRWEIPRSDFPDGVVGYKKWRTRLALFHGETAASILAAAGYEDAVIQRVKDLLLKKGLKSDPEVQLFEDAICLVFLENELADFAKKHDEQKLVDILKKTWDKMSPVGQAVALQLAGDMPGDVRALLEKAVG